MELKKFKDFKFAGNTILEEYANNEAKVEVKRMINGLFAVCINGLEVEYFRTKPAAEDAAKDAIEAMELNK